jgi:hypothetical protein
MHEAVAAFQYDSPGQGTHLVLSIRSGVSGGQMQESEMSS